MNIFVIKDTCAAIAGRANCLLTLLNLIALILSLVGTLLVPRLLHIPGVSM